mgnify:CR=1 FL=1
MGRACCSCAYISSAANRANAAEQVALQAVSLSLDRSRYALQVQVYGQYVRKMACLVEALEVITKADRGRASELVQAQKMHSIGTLASGVAHEFNNLLTPMLMQIGQIAAERLATGEFRG